MRPHKSRVKFRHSIAFPVAGLVGFFGAIPLASYRWYLAPILLIPALIAVWGWRTGLDVDRTGITVRALASSRRIAWDDIEGFALREGHVAAMLSGNGVVPLSAIKATDLDDLLAAGGQQVKRTDPIESIAPIDEVSTPH